jgi:hypothetical protein
VDELVTESLAAVVEQAPEAEVAAAPVFDGPPAVVTSRPRRRRAASRPAGPPVE